MPEVGAVLKDFIEGVVHVGFVVEDLEVAVADACRLYGIGADEVRYAPEPGEPAETRFAFFTVAGQEFELIEPVSEAFKEQLLNMPSGGGGINHVAWRVRDIEGAVAALDDQGVVPGHVTPEGIVEIGKAKMVYLDPATTGGLVVELLEYPRAEDEH